MKSSFLGSRKQFKVKCSVLFRAKHIGFRKVYFSTYAEYGTIFVMTDIKHSGDIYQCLRNAITSSPPGMNIVEQYLPPAN